MGTDLCPTEIPMEFWRGPRKKDITRRASRRGTFFLRPPVGVQRAPPHPDRVTYFTRLFLMFTCSGCIENDEYPFENAITRRSAKGAPQKFKDFLWGPRTCTGGVTASCKSRRAQRPRKLDEKLNRHGRSARRVAFLRPCRDFSQYRSPLDYVSAIPKILVFV